MATSKVVKSSTGYNAANKPIAEPQEKSNIPIKAKPVAAKPERKADPLKEVKLPKIITKTSVPYNPDYVPMEKRVDAPKTNSPLVKYSDADLNEFRDIINKKMDTAKKELAYLQGLITRKDEMGGDNDDARYMTMEDGSMSMEREQLSQMASRQISYIDHLEKAIMRIENKTYGVCRVTGKLIDKARLKAVPHATLSLEAKLGLVKPSGD
ncbi:TraR/DksA family transcriptional regulator [Parasediminibacterium sp. JCM 36343]|uniref:TraR/DksA family transcriptional regulator n=1 Tax=Parasediminibacterium sp. JCM 36343 TaxID=3374279 RepID=UPI00397C45B8